MKGRNHLEEASLFDATPSWRINLQIELAKVKLHQHDLDTDLDILFSLAGKNTFKTMEGWNSRNLGEILLKIDDQHMAQSESWIQKAIHADRNNGMRFMLGRDYSLYSEWFARIGDRLKAQENLGRAIEVMQECGADGWVEKYKKELSVL